MTCPNPHRQQDEYVCNYCGLRWDVNEGKPMCPQKKPTIIGISGAAGSGKSTAAKHLVENHGFVVMKFADTLKDMVRQLFYDLGYDERMVEEMIEGDLKEFRVDRLGCATPRYIMQTLGTDWGRDLIASDIWIMVWKERVGAVLREEPDARIVVDDVRFDNEADAVRQMGGKVLRLERNDLPLVNAHQSENGIAQWDMMYRNDGTLEELTWWLDRVI